MAVSVHRRSLRRGLSRQYPLGSEEPKPVGGSNSSTMGQLIVRLRGVLPTTVTYGAVPVCGSKRVVRAHITSDGLRRTARKASAFCLPESKRGLVFPCSTVNFRHWPTDRYPSHCTVRKRFTMYMATL